jgi:hypothetical protein
MIELLQTTNGTFTLCSGGNHLTFKIATSKSKNPAFNGKRIVSLMTGRDNENDYTGIGTITKGGFFQPWHEYLSGANGVGGRRRVVAYNPATKELLTRQQLIACVNLILENGNFGDTSEDVCENTFSAHGREYKLMISSACMRCNSKLTNPESITSGYGPECRKVMN